jgi:hypothetical protein
MAGTVSHRATTTIKVAQRADLDPDTYFLLISDALRDQGYVTRELMRKRDVSDWVHDLSAELLYLAGSAGAGTILERRGDLVNVRRTTE